MRIFKGSALVEYVLPTALIGIVVGLGLFYMHSNGTMGSFFASNSNSKLDPTSQKLTLDENKQTTEILLNPSQGSLGGTPDVPVKQCSNGVCNIDFGTYLLSGIPEDFNEFIRTSGVSGGTDKIQQLMQQIAKQLEGTEDDALADDIMKLANMGHNIALIQQSIEDHAIKCNGDELCLNNIRTKLLPKPPGYIDSASPYPASINYEKAIYAGSIGDANYHLNTPLEEIKADWPSYDPAIMNTMPNYQYYEQFKKIIDSPNYNSEVASIIKELTWDLGTIGEEFQNNYNYMSGSTTQSVYDPVTGIRKKEVPAPEGYDYEAFKNYDASTITNFDSSLICASSANQDTGTLCH